MTTGILLFAGTAAQAACERSYRTIAEPGTHGEAQGVDRLQVLMNDLGCKLDISIVTSSHARRERLLAEGRIDVLAEASFLPSRAGFSWFSRAYRLESVYLYLRSADVHRYPVLKPEQFIAMNLRIAVPLSGWFGPEVERLRPQWEALKRTHHYAPVIDAVRDLRRLRVDVAVGTDLAEWQVSDITQLQPAVYTGEVGLLFSKRTVKPEEVAAFDAAILNRYGEIAVTTQN